MIYKLLKDMPGVKAGTIFHEASGTDLPTTVSTKVKWYVPVGKWCPTFSEEDMQNTEWFEPIYQWPTKWEDVKVTQFDKTYFANSGGQIGSRVITSVSCLTPIDSPSYAHVKSMLAFAQLSMLAAEMNGDWTYKPLDYYFTVGCDESKLAVLNLRCRNSQIHFKTKEMAEFSAKHHADLWKQYFMIE